MTDRLDNPRVNQCHGLEGCIKSMEILTESTEKLLREGFYEQAHGNLDAIEHYAKMAKEEVGEMTDDE